jgi:glucose-1-phosphate adenylyltransferase
VLAVVMAGGAGGRLELLTSRRAKPAVPFAGLYRLIDFPLSNCLHSGLADVWVIEQFNPFALSDHLANGRPWDLDRTRGGLVVLHPHLGAGAQGWHRGTADAIWRNAPLLRDFGPDALVVLSADAVYRLDYRDVIDGHLDADADVTMVTTEVASADAGRYGVVQVDGQGRITDYAYKPDEPRGNLVSNEVFVFRPGRMLDLLDEIAEDAGDDAEELEDFGDGLLPRLVDGGRARAHHLDGYWRDVGTIQSYFDGHMDLLGDEPTFELDDLSWPILTRGQQRPPARIAATASVEDAGISPGAIVRGRVQRSVLSPGVVVEEGATVCDAVVLHGTVVRAGATVERAVVDADVEISGDARVGERDGDLVLVGQHERVEPGSVVRAGARLPEGREE